MDVEIFEAEIKNEILITRGQSHIIVNFCLIAFNVVVDCFNSLHK